MNEGKPENVRLAVFADDRTALSRMGQKGARQRQINRIILKKEREEMLKKVIIQNRYEANENIVDPDG